MLSLDQQNTLRNAYRRQHPHWQPATETYAALVRAQLSPSACVLDLGCGRGGLVEQLAHPLTHITGIDPDMASLREHRLPLPRCAATSSALPFAAESFDVVFCSWLLEHLAQPANTITQVARVLRPGGTFVFITPNARHPLSWVNRGLGRFAAIQGWLVAKVYGRHNTDTFPTYYLANTPRRLESLATGSQLQLAALFTIPDPTYLALTPTLFRLSAWFENRLPTSRAIHLVGMMIKPRVD